MSSDIRFYTLRELKAMPRDPDKYLIDGFVWEGDHVVLLGSDKSGKSILAMQMACAVSCGEAFLGEYEVPEPMPSAYIQTEGKRDELVERFNNMTGPNGVAANEDNLHILTTHSWALDSEDGYLHIVALLEKILPAPRIIFLDPLYMSMIGDLNDNMASRTMARNIRRISAMFRAAIVVIHHEHKSKHSQDGAKIEEGDNAIMGSFVWKAFPDHVIHLRLRPDKIRVISCTTQRSSRVVENMQLHLVQPTPLFYTIIGTPDHMPYVDSVYEVIKKANGAGLSAKEIQESSKLSISAVKKSLAYLSKPNVNRVYKINPGKRPTCYSSVKRLEREA